MAKLIIMAVVAIMVCCTIGYTAKRVCDTLDRSNVDRVGEYNTLRSDHEMLMKDHEAIIKSVGETHKIAVENNRMLTHLYNISMANNPVLNDMKR